jgi:hypothetical protein
VELLLLGQLALSSVPSGCGQGQQLLSSEGFEELLRGRSATTVVDQSETGVVRLPSVSAVDDDDDDDDDVDDEEADEEDEDDKDGR